MNAQDGFAFWVGKIAADLAFAGILVGALLGAVLFKVYVWDELAERRSKKGKAD